MLVELLREHPESVLALLRAAALNGFEVGIRERG